MLMAQILLVHSTLCRSGFKEGRSADSFDEWSYLASYTDLINAYGTDTSGATQHYVAHGFKEGRSADAFDEWNYLASYTDLIKAYGTDTAGTAGTCCFWI